MFLKVGEVFQLLSIKDEGESRKPLAMVADDNHLGGPVFCADLV